MVSLSARSLSRSLALCALCLLMASCAGVSEVTTKAYLGQERPTSEVAVIKCGFYLALVAIDENKSFSGAPLKCQFAVLPGKHSFRVKIQDMNYGRHGYVGGYQQKIDQVVEYELKAGRSYLLGATGDEKLPALWTIFILDPETKKFVHLQQVNLP